jgi:hypothetical protein
MNPPRGQSPSEVFAPWLPAQLAIVALAPKTAAPPDLLRRSGFLPPALAEQITDWYTGQPSASDVDARTTYAALQRETEQLFSHICAPRSAGGLGVRTRRGGGDRPYRGAGDLCAELREHGSMAMTTFGMVAPGERHPLIGCGEGGLLEQLLVVHDVLGHAALGVGFDLQSEFATWLQRQVVFSPVARRAAFCELVGRVTTYILSGERPGLRADLPPLSLFAACDVGRIVGTRHRGIGM